MTQHPCTSSSQRRTRTGPLRHNMPAASAPKSHNRGTAAQPAAEMIPHHCSRLLEGRGLKQRVSIHCKSVFVLAERPASTVQCTSMIPHAAVQQQTSLHWTIHCYHPTDTQWHSSCRQPASQATHHKQSKQSKLRMHHACAQGTPCTHSQLAAITNTPNGTPLFAAGGWHG